MPQLDGGLSRRPLEPRTDMRVTTNADEDAEQLTRRKRRRETATTELDSDVGVVGGYFATTETRTDGDVFRRSTVDGVTDKTEELSQGNRIEMTINSCSSAKLTAKGGRALDTWSSV